MNMESLSFTVTELLFCVHHRFSKVINVLLLLLYNAQMIVLFFGNNYVITTMLTNVDSVEALSGKTVSYIIGVIIVVVFSILSVKECVPKGKWKGIVSIFSLILEVLVCVILNKGQYSPGYNTCDVMVHMYSLEKARQNITAGKEQIESCRNLFYRSEVDDFVKKTVLCVTKEIEKMN